MDSFDVNGNGTPPPHVIYKSVPCTHFQGCIMYESQGLPVIMDMYG